METKSTNFQRTWFWLKAKDSHQAQATAMMHKAKTEPRDATLKVLATNFGLKVKAKD